MTWIEARRKLRNQIEIQGQMEMQLTEGRGLMRPVDIDPTHLNNNKYPVAHRTIVAKSLSYAAVKDCSSRSLNELLLGINDPDWLIRVLIADACGACGYAPAIPALIRRFKDSNDSKEMENLAFALTAMGESAVPALIDLNLSIYYVEGDHAKENMVYRATGSALVSMGPDVVDWLLGMFLDEHPYRWIASVPICLHYGDIYKQKLTKMMYDPAYRSNQMLMERISDVLKHIN